MESIGDTLREARHNKKASIEDAARATKIKLAILEKLEADEFGELAAPMYTKGFLKLYADYLGLDSAAIVDAYLKSQGGLRRQGLHVETEASIRARKPRELQLPVASVVRIVTALTVVVLLVLGGRRLWVRRAKARATAGAEAKPTSLPAADFEALAQPKKDSAGELLDLSGK